VDANDKEGSLKLWSPAEPHDLFQGRLNAPRVLLEVEGDFTVEVRILGALVAEPGLERADRKLSYRSGSLIVWRDDGNYIRFDRAGLLRTAGRPTPYMDFQLFKDGTRAVAYSPACLDEDATLRIERQENAIRASWQEGEVRKRLPALTVNWPAKVKFGVAAINISTQPFQAAFDGFKLITGNGVDLEVTFEDFMLTR
jgi:regulation of enolase protein 1 (concanavalin A-like superfamily)